MRVNLDEPDYELYKEPLYQKAEKPCRSCGHPTLNHFKCKTCWSNTPEEERDECI